MGHRFCIEHAAYDEFFVLYEELYFEGELIGYGDILAAEFVNQGKRYEAVQYVTETGRKDYFTPAGVSMRKAFLRAPVEFSHESVLDSICGVCTRCEKPYALTEGSIMQHLEEHRSWRLGMDEYRRHLVTVQTAITSSLATVSSL